MNLKTWAEENGKTLAEAKEITGLTHWNQEVVVDTPEVAVAPEVVEAPAENLSDKLEQTQDLMRELMKDGKTAEKAYTGAKMTGEKSKYFSKLSLLKELADPKFVAKFEKRLSRLGN